MRSCRSTISQRSQCPFGLSGAGWACPGPATLSVMSTPRALNTWEHSEVPLRCMPSTITIGRRDTALASDVTALVRVVRCSDDEEATMPSSIADLPFGLPCHELPLGAAMDCYRAMQRG